MNHFADPFAYLAGIYGKMPTTSAAFLQTLRLFRSLAL